jgi:hypothetical protein
MTERVTGRGNSSAEHGDEFSDGALFKIDVGEGSGETVRERVFVPLGVAAVNDTPSEYQDVRMAAAGDKDSEEEPVVEPGYEPYGKIHHYPTQHRGGVFTFVSFPGPIPTLRSPRTRSDTEE